jgi:hypothetical protein
MSLEFINPQLATAVDHPSACRVDLMKSNMTDTAQF